jgi:hypothetical protein
MLEHLRSYWWVYWAVLASIGIGWLRFARSDPELSRRDRFRSLLRGHRYYDRSNPAYDPGLPSRQGLLVFIGVPLVALALVISWAIEN